MASFFHSDPPTFEENRWNAKTIQTVKNIWHSQHAIFELLNISEVSCVSLEVGTILRYIRIFHVTSEQYFVLLRKRGRFEKAIPFIPARCIRTFDVISEVKCVSPRMEADLQKALTRDPAPYIRTFDVISKKIAFY